MFQFYWLYIYIFLDIFFIFYGYILYFLITYLNAKCSLHGVVCYIFFTYFRNKYFFNHLVHSVQYIGRLTKIFILILEGILKKFPMSVATMSR